MAKRRIKNKRTAVADRRIAARKRNAVSKRRTARIESNASKKPKKWIVALILSVFFGVFGVDRFYLGYTGTGILKLLISVCTLGFGAWIWWLIDLLLIATRYEFKKIRWID